MKSVTIGAFAHVIGFSSLKWILVAKSTKLFKSAPEKRDLKKHLSPSVVVFPKFREQNFATESRR